MTCFVCWAAAALKYQQSYMATSRSDMGPASALGDPYTINSIHNTLAYSPCELNNLLTDINQVLKEILQYFYSTQSDRARAALYVAVPAPLVHRHSNHQYSRFKTPLLS